jgi:hypothetical protein
VHLLDLLLNGLFLCLLSLSHLFLALLRSTGFGGIRLSNLWAFIIEIVIIRRGGIITLAFGLSLFLLLPLFLWKDSTILELLNQIQNFLLQTWIAYVV